MSKKRKRIPRNEAANNAVGFINSLTGTNDYSDQPFKLRKWQEDFVRQLFGTLDKEGKRQYKKAFLFLPRGNGKTGLTACLVLYALCCWPAGQQIYSCAADREQAALIFKAVQQMIEANEILSGICEVVKSQKRIVIPSKHSFYCATSADAHRQHGLSPSLCIYDEMHCAKNAELYEAMITGLNKRENSLFVGITTAGVYEPTHIAYQEYDYAKRVAAGDIDDPNYLPLIFEADRNDSWTSEKTWKKCNPALGDFLPVEGIANLCKEAQELPSRENAFRQYHLNQWSQSVTRWLSMEKWDACGETTFDVAELKGRFCYAGLDVGPVHDLTSLALLFPMDDGTYRVLSYSWCNEAEIKNRSKFFPYDLWVKQGFLRSTPGETTKTDYIREDINELADLYNIKVIAADMAFCFTLGQQLNDDDGIPVEWYRPGFKSQGPPTYKLEKLIIDCELLHNNNPLLKWAAGNCCTEKSRDGVIRISKDKSTEKIDPIWALVAALGAEIIYSDDEQESVYESRGIEFF